jgi:hypothetical protein
MSWLQKLQQLTCGHEIVYADRSSEDEQLLASTLLRKRTASY